jgi:large subunit ribosomal protein L15
MQINTLQLNNKRKAKKTIGRGGKKGTYSGKGMKGQKARSGAHIDPLFEGGRSTLIDHMKKKRGFKSLSKKPAIVKFAALAKKFENGATITIEDLVKNNLVKKVEAKNGVKILGPKDGKNTFSFEKGIKVSKSVE